MILFLADFAMISLMHKSLTVEYPEEFPLFCVLCNHFVNNYNIKINLTVIYINIELYTH
jgi:hypothetical protein